nr:YbaK/EbsC family protein [Agrobacterium tumefaciens]
MHKVNEFSGVSSYLKRLDIGFEAINVCEISDCEADRCIKTIAFEVRGGQKRFILACLQRDQRINLSKLAHVAGLPRSRLFWASPESLKNNVGIEPGAISPFVETLDADVFVHADILQHPWVYVGSGDKEFILRIETSTLRRIPNLHIAEY